METEKEASGIRLTQVVLPLLVGVLGTWAWQQYPSGNSRPAALHVTQGTTRQEQRVDARLWQDPFDAVAQHQKAERSASPAGTPHHGGDKLNGEIWDKLEALACNPATAPGEDAEHHEHRKLTVFAVMVSGGPYFEDTEQRRRIRYAVLSGINVLSQHYSPDDPEHIEFVDFEEGQSRATHSESDAAAQLPRILPYEWVQIHQNGATTGKYGRAPAEDAVVLWLNGDYFTSRPIQALYQLLQRILEQHPPACSMENAAVASRLRIRVLGPDGSNTLQALWHEASHWNSSAQPAELQDPDALKSPDLAPQPPYADPLKSAAWLADLDVAIYSPRATVHECSLFDGCAESVDRTLSDRIEALKEDGFPFRKLSFIRTTATDDKLALALKEELERRQIVPGPEQHVVLISEWDTLYGWTLPRTFRAALEPNECGTGDETEFHATDQPIRTCVHRFSYLRGMDGEAARQKDQDYEKSDKSGAPDRTGLSDFTEKPEGEAQFDYLRRLATKLGHLEAAIRQQNPNASIRAIGVLASDVYDKLLILRALRQYFPEAVFFTTDLDERLLHPSQNDWTRNLLIVSGFGFELASSLQRDIPPFRDGYQTSYFLATQMALRSRNGWQQNVVDRWLNPRVFEIGRTETVDLTAKPPGFKLNRCQDLQACVHIHPSMNAKFGPPGMRHTLFALAGTSACVLFLCVAFPGFRLWTYKYRYWLISGALGLLALSLCGWLVWLQSHASIEPWRWFEGISVWPSEIIRLIAVAMATAFIRQTLCLQGSNKLRDQLTAIAKDFFGEEKARDVQAQCAASWLPPWREFWPAVTRHWDPDFGKPKDHQQAGPSPAIAAETLWDEYLRQIARRPLRALIHAGLLGLFGFCLLLALGFPQVPARGLAALVVDRIVLASAVVAFCYLLVLVFDTARVTERLVDYFGDPQVQIIWRTENASKNASETPWDEARISLKSTYFVGRLTAMVGSLVWYPFFVVILLMAARSRFFDDWHTPAALWTVYGVSFLMIFVRIYGLGRAAQKVKDLEIGRITERRDQTLLTWGRGAPEQLTRADRILAMLQNYQEGAFAPITNKPVFRGLMALIGTQGIIQVLEAFVLNSVR